VLLLGVLLALPLGVLCPPSELAGAPPLELTSGGVTVTLPPPPCPDPEPALAGDAEVEAPGELVPDDGAPEVSGVGIDPLKPLLPPPRASGAVGVRTSTPLLGVSASLRPLEVLPEPIAAGLAPGLDSLRRSQAVAIKAKRTAKNTWHRLRGAATVRSVKTG
jgi:hypothetical protein